MVPLRSIKLEIAWGFLTLLILLVQSKKAGFYPDKIGFFGGDGREGAYSLDWGQTIVLHIDDISKNYALGSTISELNKCGYFGGVRSMLGIFGKNILRNLNLTLVKANLTTISLSYSKQAEQFVLTNNLQRPSNRKDFYR